MSDDIVDDILDRLVRTNDELIKCVNWMMEQNNMEAAAKLFPITSAFASILAEMGAKLSEVHTRRSQMSVVRKRRR
jgi:hypothetical protein